MVMSSLRRPKCITIRGNDQKDHKFLVKGGEDQRQDQRIETLFELINDLLKSDPRCYQRNLSIKTYQVIPMTSKLALIEWIPDTKTLKSICEDPESDDKLKEAFAKYTDFINRVVPDRPDQKVNFIEKFSLTYEKYSRNFVCNEFEKIQNMVPWDLLRKYLRSLSSSTEAYFVLRNQFISSYAVASACQYMLGIGDRHLSNWIMDGSTGRAIGIDFGMAFGHATMNIPVPELMPIRLTRQILKLIAPLEHRGLFESSMLHTLRALRENNDILMCILDVFIKEPSVDWMVVIPKIIFNIINCSVCLK
jgi:DNA-dependent protein kinase catalytic subunit